MAKNIMELKLNRTAVIFLCLILFFAAANADDVKADDSKEVGIKRYGFVHNIASDRKVEKIGGTYEPEGLDKYIQRRVNELSDQITEAVKQLSDQLSGLETQLDRLDKEISEIKKGMKDGFQKDKK